MKKSLIALLVSLIVLFAMPLNAFADFGDYGGDYDEPMRFGFNGKKVNVVDANVSVDDAEDSLVNVVGVFILVCIGLIVFVSVKRKKERAYRPRMNNYAPTQGNHPLPPGATATDTSTLAPISSYVNLDANFSELELKEKLSNVYIQMQNCWQAKNIEQLRPYFTDSLFAQFDRQLDSYRRNKQTNMIERIAVLDVSLKGWRQQSGNDEIIAIVQTRIVDYTIDDTTGNVVRGSKTAEKFMTYEYSLTRKTGVKTGVNDGTKVIKCPQCGAPIDVNKSAKCEYCGSIVTVDSTDWTINQIKGIAQRTQGR